MKILLTPKEFEALVPKESLQKSESNLLSACKKLAELVGREGRPNWKGCVASGTAEYCDECPARQWCPYDRKEWSK